MYLYSGARELAINKKLVLWLLATLPSLTGHSRSICLTAQYIAAKTCTGSSGILSTLTALKIRFTLPEHFRRSTLSALLDMARQTLNGIGQSSTVQSDWYIYLWNTIVDLDYVRIERIESDVRSVNDGLGSVSKNSAYNMVRLDSTTSTLDSVLHWTFVSVIHVNVSRRPKM